MRLCQLCQFVSGALPQAKRVVSVVSVPPPAVFKPSGGWRGFHGMLAIWKKIRGGPTATTDTTPRESMKIDEPAAEVRLGPRAQNILDVLRWTAEGMTRKQISPGSSSNMSNRNKLGLPCENSGSEPAGGIPSGGSLPPHKTTWKKTTLINLHARGIRSGDAIIRDDGVGHQSQPLDPHRSCSQVSRKLSGQPGIPQSR